MGVTQRNVPDSNCDPCSVWLPCNNVVENFREVKGK